MNETLLTNLGNPVLLFFLLGALATLVKSDLEIPASSSKFISIYLLFSIGFKGGQELLIGGLHREIWQTCLFGVTTACLIPLYAFQILKRRLSVSDAAVIAASYGSVSAVTFVSAVAFLNNMGLESGGHMVAVMALMESPAIVIGIFLLNHHSQNQDQTQRISLGKILHHSLTNGSVFLILGSMIIGLLADTKQAEGIKPFTTDIFKGFLAIFLLEMGMITVKRFEGFRKYGLYVTVFAILFPLLNGSLAALVSTMVTQDPANRFILTVLVASASYIAVPAAMRIAAPQADPGLYIPMALGVTFPINLTIGLPYYFYLINVVLVA